MLSIGELSKRVGVGVQTLRYYEREGLLDAPTRNASGYRVYAETDLTRLNFIRRAQELGFTLREIRELIALQVESTADCTAVRHAAEDKLRSVEAKIEDLSRMRDELDELIQTCHGTGPVARCEIIECLSRS